MAIYSGFFSLQLIISDVHLAGLLAFTGQNYKINLCFCELSITYYGHYTCSHISEIVVHGIAYGL